MKAYVKAITLSLLIIILQSSTLLQQGKKNKSEAQKRYKTIIFW